MRVSPDDPTKFLFELPDLANHSLLETLPARHRDALAATADWARSYLCRTHPELGRTGPVCPYAERSMERCLFFFVTCGVRGSEIGQARDLIETYRTWFRRLSPTVGEEALFKTILVIFPEISTDEASESIDVLQKQLKIGFVNEGLMLGQFHELNADPGLWNRNFKPLRSPIPLLAIRHMVPGDFGFMEEKLEYVEAYMRHFSDQVPRRLRSRVRQVLEGFGLETMGLEAAEP